MAPISEPGLIPLLLAGLAVGAAAFVVMADRLRSAAWFLWACGMCVGGIYLAVGAEYLAFVQWTISTLAAISFVFYSVLFGEEKSPAKGWGWVALAFTAGIGFFAAAVTALRDLAVAEKPASGATVNLSALGKALISGDYLSLKVLVITLLVVTVGAGVLSRPETED